MAYDDGGGCSHSPGGGRGDVYFASKAIDMGRCRELSKESLEYLGKLVRSTEKVITKHRVAAARAILTYSQWREEHEAKHSPEARFVAMLGGPDKAAAWLAENLDRVRALLPSTHTDTKENDNG